MKLNIFKMIDAKTQKLLLGGLVGSLTYWADLAVADTQTWYPAELKARIAPQLPRNDELLTSIAPVAAMYVIGKKKAKVADMAKGTVLYSLPHLMQRVVVNAVKPAVPAVGMQLRMAPVPNGTTYPKPIPVRVQAPMATQAMGKYR